MSSQSYLIGAPLEHEGLSPRALAYSRIWISCQLSDLDELLFESPRLCRLSSRLDTSIMLLTAIMSACVPGKDVLFWRVAGLFVTTIEFDGSETDSDFFFPKKPIISLSVFSFSSRPSSYFGNRERDRWLNDLSHLL